MAAQSKIEWTDATWNPIVGCSLVSPGCTNCYAMKQAARIERMREGTWRKMGVPAPPGGTYEGLTKETKTGAVWTGDVRLVDSALTAPLRWKRPRRIFVNSMGDLFHESVPDEQIDRVFAVMALAPQHTFQVLTKRSKRMRAYVSSYRDDGQGFLTRNGEDGYTSKANMPPKRWPLPNLWLGVSVEDQPRADERIPDLLATPAAVRFVSAEPLLGEIDFTSLPSVSGIGRHLDALSKAGAKFSDLPGRLDWVIVGGESGPRARPMHPDWARGIRDQCAESGVPFFFKQWGEWTPGENVEAKGTLDTASYFAGEWSFGRQTQRESEETHVDDEPNLYRVGKRRAGRLLYGVEHNAFPEAPQ